MASQKLAKFYTNWDPVSKTIVTIVISFVFSSWIINEFEKCTEELITYFGCTTHGLGNYLVPCLFNYTASSLFCSKIRAGRAAKPRVARAGERGKSALRSLSRPRYSRLAASPLQYRARRFAARLAGILEQKRDCSQSTFQLELWISKNRAWFVGIWNSMHQKHCPVSGGYKSHISQTRGISNLVVSTSPLSQRGTPCYGLYGDVPLERVQFLPLCPEQGI